METRLSAEPEITRTLMNVCDANNSKWFLSSIKNKHQKITEKISGYFNHFLKNETWEYKEIISICFVYALKNILEKEANEEFATLLDNEFKYTDFSEINYKNNIKINNVILEIQDSLGKDSNNIEFNNIPVKIKSIIKTLKKSAPGLESLLDIINEVCMIPLNENCTEQDYLTLIDKLTTAIIQTRKYNLLKIIDKKNDMEKIITNKDFSFWHYMSNKAISSSNYMLISDICDSFPDNETLQIYILLSAISNNSSRIAKFALKKIIDLSVSTNTMPKLKIIADEIHSESFNFWIEACEYGIEKNYFSLIEYINCQICPTHKSHLLLFMLGSLECNYQKNIAEYLITANQQENLLLKCDWRKFEYLAFNTVNISTILIMTSSLTLLKKWLPELIQKKPVKGQETFKEVLGKFLLGKAINHSQKEIVLWLLDNQPQNPFTVTITHLGIAMKMCIEKKEKTIIDWEISHLISKDKRFNPNNYISSHSLIEIAATERDFTSAILLLEHKKINLNWIKDTLFAKAIENDNYQLIGFLLNLSKFSFLEKDWSVWAQKKKLPEDKNISFQAIIAIYRVWYQLKAFSQIEGIVSDVTNLIVKNLYRISCPTPPSFIHGLFGKKPEVIANDTNSSQNLTISFAQITPK